MLLLLARSSPSEPVSSEASCSLQAGSIFKLLLLILSVGPAVAEPVGSAACRACHLKQYVSQSASGHARALARRGETWLFGSGLQAVTPVERVSAEVYREGGLRRYTRPGREGIAPVRGGARGGSDPVVD